MTGQPGMRTQQRKALEMAQLRIRELEAELAEWHEFLSRDSYGGSLKNALERARKAEARVAELERTLQNEEWKTERYQSALRSEAREREEG